MQLFQEFRTKITMDAIKIWSIQPLFLDPIEAQKSDTFFF